MQYGEKKISLSIIKEATEILLRKVQELHQPETLKDLSATAIAHAMKGGLDQLPLPDVLKDFLKICKFEGRRGENCYDREYYIMYCVPFLLSQHKYCYMIIG